MYAVQRMVWLAVLLLVSLDSLWAQTAGPSGYWEGSIHAPFGEARVEINLAANDKGELAGTYSSLKSNLRGFPLWEVSAKGQSVSFTLKASSGGGKFEGTLSGDAKGISGIFITAEGGYAVPFDLSRTGNARIEAPSKGPRIAKEMEGVWTGLLDMDGKKLGIVLTMSNEADGTSRGILSFDGLALPITVTTQKDSNLAFDITSVGASYTGALTAEGKALVGTYKEGTFVQAVALQRSEPGR